MSPVVVDLPALAEEHASLSVLAGPLATQHLTAARTAVSAIQKLAADLDKKFGGALSAVEHGEPGTDFDFLVGDLLDLQGRLTHAQVEVTSSMQLLMRANISYTAACTLAACGEMDTQ